MDSLHVIKRRLEIPDNSEDALILDMLADAKRVINNNRYPFGGIPLDEAGEEILEDRFLSLQIRIVLDMYNKMGAEGQVTHSENGVARTFETADVPYSLLREIIPKGGVL